jgi:hypothetical protein
LVTPHGAKKEIDGKPSDLIVLLQGMVIVLDVQMYTDGITFKPNRITIGLVDKTRNTVVFLDSKTTLMVILFRENKLFWYLAEV